MSLNGVELGKTIIGTLCQSRAISTLATGGIHSGLPPRNVPCPHLWIGLTSGPEQDSEASELLMTLHVRSKAGGPSEAAEILAASKDALTRDVTLAISDAFADLRFEFSEVRFDEELGAYHGLLRHRLVLSRPATGH